MIPLLVVGVVLLGMGGWLLRRDRQVAALGGALRSAPVLSCADAASRAAGGPAVCQLSGAVEPGPDGPLTAPLSGQPCVWYHVRVSARKRGADGLSYDRRQHEESSTAPFRLRDGSGAVLVDPRGARADFVAERRAGTGTRSYPQTVERYEKKGHEHLIDLRAFGSIVGANEVVGHLYEEWALAPGDTAHLLGAVRAGGDGPTLAAPGSGPFLLSVREPGQQARLAQAAVGLRRTPALACLGAGAVLLVVGLVASVFA